MASPPPRVESPNIEPSQGSPDPNPREHRSDSNSGSGDANCDPPILPWDRFSQWVYCVCVVTFDIELGQAIEQIYPGHVKLTEREKSNICYLAFPDSNSGCMGDTQFHFRTRLCPIRRKTISLYKEYNKNCLVALEADASYFYGYVYFRQIKDRSARRGYFQKSLVLLTRLPFITLFSQVVSLIALQFFDNGAASLEAGCKDIDRWADPMPGSTLNLPLMGITIQVRIPHKNEKLTCSPSAEPSSSLIYSQDNPQTPSLIIPSVQELNIFKNFLPVISHIQLLWELTLTCEPLIVMAPTPDICCEVVQALVSTIWPLKFASDFRPFFTIHDSEFKEYTTKTQAPPPVILGVTNPFFAKTLQHWPHIIRVGEYGSISPQNIKPRKGALKTLDWKPSVYTKYKCFLQKDRNILKKLLKGMESRRPFEVQSALTRRYLLELTQSFLIPLERYLASLMPLQKNISPFKATPSIQPFNPEDFLKTIEVSGPQLTCGIRGDWNGLYKKFFRCPNFSAWYENRYKEVNQQLKALHIKAISDANLLAWVQDKAEVEVVDLVLRLKDKLKAVETENLPLNHETTSKLEALLKEIISSLSPDLQLILSK